MLWKYYAHHRRFFEAAEVQLTLAKSSFDLTLEQRIRYLSQAKTNASARLTGVSDVRMTRQSRQELLREATDLLDLANIQGDILERMRSDRRLTADRRPQVLRELNGRVLPLDDLFSIYTDQAAYYDLSLLIYAVADHRDLTNIRATWQNLFEQLHDVALHSNQRPWEVVADKMRELGTRLQLNETVFHIPTVVLLLETYAFQYQRGHGGPTWVADVFLDLGVPHEQLVAVLESIWYNNEAPFTARARRWPAQDLIRVCEAWFDESSRGGGYAFGGVENAAAIIELLSQLQAASLLDQEFLERTIDLRGRIEVVLR